MHRTELLEALPAAVYTTDPEGRITFYNDAAAELWGHRPVLGAARWCGSWRLYRSDGQPMSHNESPMAITLQKGEPLDGVETVAERPDGSRVPFISHPRVIRDASGRITDGISLLVEVAGRKQVEIQAARLAAIIASSDDAIVSKSLDGRVTSWNVGAIRIFGYEPEEMIGQSIKRIIPSELHQEEDEILARLRHGERIEHFDTVRIAKDGRRVDISLTVSPIRDRTGHIIGASKVARDVTERKRSEELQRLLLAELNHRVKNTLAMIQSIANQSLRPAASLADFAASFSGRVDALARAHDLLVQQQMRGADLLEIVREQVLLGATDRSRISCSGPLVALDGQTAIHFALVLHELATNARKYGALSVSTGELSISWKLLRQPEAVLVLEWRETQVPLPDKPLHRGFGTTLVERTAQANGGTAHVLYTDDGLLWEIQIRLLGETPQTTESTNEISRERCFGSATERRAIPDIRGKRILVIEDEPLVALDIEAHLESFGCETIGPATTVAEAHEMIENSIFDAALVDANLGGSPVDDVAAALRRRAVRFAFATGYGPDGLPEGFRERLVLTKPFHAEELRSILQALIGNVDR